MTMRRILPVLLAAVLCWAVATPALAQDEDTGWTVESFDARLRVTADGTVEVSEEIAVDFADLERHGIFRVIPVRYAIAEGDAQVDLPEGRDVSEYRRVLRVEGIEVESTAPAETEISREGDDLVIRIGDPDVTVSGQHTYRLRYLVDGALNAFSDRAELNWNVTGNGWPVPIREATATVEGPDVVGGSCAQGPPGATTACEEEAVGDGRARFSASQLPPGEGLTVAVALPPDAVTVQPALIEERRTLSRAMAGSPAALPLAALTALVGFGGVALLARRGRDETDPGELLGTPPAPRLDPPEGLRPAQLGVLLDERIDETALSATLVDLAARGLIDIEQVPSDGKPDWRLHRRRSADTDLLDYEHELVEALFEEGDVVTVSDLRGEFSDTYGRFRELVYADAVERGWFPRSPAATRTRWLVIAILALLVTGALLGLALAFTDIAIAALPLFLAALALLVVHRFMPRRTAAGRRLLGEARSFRAMLTSTAPPPGVDPATGFASALPYAIAFGAAPALVRRFAALGVPPRQWAPSWYYYPVGYHAWYDDPSTMSADLAAFADTVGGDLSTSPASSTSGGGTSSGAGFGGGGGGSW